MKVLKPSWVGHEGKAIFSIDIHPDGSRFATGGQGDDAGQVVIWNMAPVREEEDELDESTPKMLCLMTNHLACVNCVRWSRSGRYLASGGDDKLIMIWQISRYSAPAKVFGSSKQEKIVEQWRPVFTLRGHSGDVLDLAWSPEDVWLASCSVDNTIVVWNALKFPEQVAVLQEHKGLVKGVTWDPVGKYLASQSDDRSLRIWRTRDWKQEVSITKPFAECSGTTHVLRLDWAPDGHYIVSAHAMNNSGPTAQIIERVGWEATLDFVGHRKAVSVVRFNPHILSKKSKKASDKALQYSCCAIGSKDRSISIWLTALKRPLVVMHDLFSCSVMDISWASNGQELMCCSSDGTVAFLSLDQAEMGIPLSQIEMQDTLERMYGKGLPLSAATKPGAQVIESAAMLKLQECLQGKEEKKEAGATAAPAPVSQPLIINGDSSSTQYKARNKQIETKTPDGRRRITPIFLEPQLDEGPCSDIPQPFQSKRILFTSTREQSKIVVEKHGQPAVGAAATTPVLTPALAPAPGVPGEPSASSTPAPPNTESATPPQQAEVPRASLFQPLAPDPTDSNKKEETPTEQATPANEAEREKEERNKETPVSTKEWVDRVKEKPRLSLGKRKREEKRYGKVGRPRKVDVLAREAAERAASMANSQVTPSLASLAVDDAPRVRAVPELQIPVPSIEKNAQVQVSAGVQLHVENGVQTGAGLLHRLRCTEHGKATWEHILKAKINTVDASNAYVCVGCEDNTVAVFNTVGRRVLPSLALNSLPAILHCRGSYVMAVSQRGSLHVWNVKLGTCTVRNEHLSNIMKPDSKIKSSSLTVEGTSIFCLDSGFSYAFSGALNSWVLVADKVTSLQMCSNHQSCMPPEGAPKGQLSTIMGGLHRVGPPSSKLYQAPMSVQQPATLSHLESQLSLSLALQAAPEYKFWLSTYIRYLAQEGMEERLRDICDELLGPVLGSRRSESSWSDTVLGMKKRDLLGELLPVMGTNLQLQRLYTEYHEQLDYIKKMG